MADPIKLLKSRMADKSLRSVATELGISAAYLSDIMNGKRSPGPTVLAALGLEKVEKRTVTYREQG